VTDYFRRPRLQQTVGLDDIGQELATAVSYTPEDVLWVRRGVERLSVADQLVILLHDVEQLTLEEIGRRIGLRKSAVAVRLQRARDNLRLALREGSGKDRAAKRLKE
jgi:RNA polymerase sigma factor (sigma-70 family)